MRACGSRLGAKPRTELYTIHASPHARDNVLKLLVSLPFLRRPRRSAANLRVNGVY